MKKQIATLLLISMISQFSQAEQVLTVTSLPTAALAQGICNVTGQGDDEWCPLMWFSATVLFPLLPLGTSSAIVESISGKADKELVYAAKDSAAAFYATEDESMITAELEAAFDEIRANKGFENFDNVSLAKIIVSIN